MLAGLLEMAQERAQRPPTPPAIALERLLQHQERYERWLLGPAPWKRGDLVTLRLDSPTGGHGALFMVADVDRHPPPMELRHTPDGALRSDWESLTEPPPRVRKTGLREDTRISFVCDDPDLSVRAFWIEGWMLEAWTVEQAEQHLLLQQAQTDGVAQ